MHALGATCIALAIIHQIGSLWKSIRNPSGLDIELIRQHHEKCALLALIGAVIAFHK